MAGQLVVIFVEGDTEFEFYNELIQYFRKNSSTSLKSFKVINLKGISRFENKLLAKLTAEVLIKYEAKNVSVVCCHDTDVFELAKKPVVDWKVLKKKILALGVASFSEVRAERMIEDWFLKDLAGICAFLKIDFLKSVAGGDGNEKMKNLFKKGGKIYTKGSPAKKFIPALNLEGIRTLNQAQLVDFEKALNVNILDKASKVDLVKDVVPKKKDKKVKKVKGKKKK